MEMRVLNLKLYSIILLSMLLAACNFQQNGTVVSEIVTIESLLKEMVDRDALAKTNAIPFKIMHVSSYSQKSISPDQPGWFDNADSRVFKKDLSITNKEYTIMDVEGPGAMVRLWSAWNPQPKYFSNGTLRIYFDHSKTPQIEGNIENVISSNAYVGEPLSQKSSPFLENGKWYSGHNFYFPLTFNKHIKITYQKGNENVEDALYFKIDYRKYNKNVSMNSYQKGDLENGTYKTLLADVNANLMQNQPDTSQYEVSSLKKEVKAGESVSMTFEGSRAIKKIQVKIKAENLEQSLRSTVLKMDFDGKSTVWAPLGDFFGTGYKISPYQSRYSNVNKEGEMTTYFPMPFEKSAKITVHNYGKEDVELVKFDLHTEPWQWNKHSLYFHANWKLFSEIKTKEKQDVNYITISGKGKHVGDALTLFNNSYYWWGEGDEKIYIDGEKFPSHFGTGTEDYYGYAWCSVVDFSTPFNAQPIGDGNRSPGLTVNSRWRMLDVMPFNTSYRFDMELWHWDKNTQMDYSPTTFWYGTKEAKAEYIENEESVQLPVKFSDKFEGESFSVKNINGGNVIIEAFLSYEWSARNHLLWKNIKKNDELETVFYSEQERIGELTAVFTNAPDYVIVDVLLNGELIFEDLDLYSEKLSLKKYYFENGSIKKGDNILKLKVKGLNKKNTKADKMGLDYLIVN